MRVSTACMVPIFILLMSERSYEDDCETKGVSQELHMNIISKRNDTGDWVSEFSALKQSVKNSSEVNVDVTFKAYECKEKQTVWIRGILKDTVRKDENRLSFHPNHGTNIDIVNDGRSIIKINNDLHGYDVAMTNRPLKDDEIFEVRLDKKISKFWYAMGIGVTTHNPSNLKLPAHMSHLATGNWMFFHTGLWRSGIVLRDNYVSKIDELGVGDRLGVKRTAFGDLHLYVNGVDQGPAISGVPSGVFGVYQLHGNAVAATIVDAK